MSDSDDSPEPTEFRAVRSGTAVKRRLAAILATDAVGYSRMMAADEEGTIRTLAAHRAVIDGIIQYHDGRIVSTAGDSVLAEFASPVEAVRCAIEVQDALKTRNDSLPEEKRLLFRIGINLGDVIVKGEDLLGDGVNIASRLESLAEPGGILVSSSVYDQISGKLSLSFTDLGEQTLKNIPRAVRAFRVAPGTGIPAAQAKAPRKRGLSSAALAGIVAAVAIVGGLGAYFGGVFPPSRPQDAASTASKPAEGEVAFWESMRNSTDPAELEAYLAKYPQGAFVALARTRLESITGQRAEETRRAEEARKNAEADAAKAKAEAEVARKQAEADKAAKAKAEVAAAQAKQDDVKKPEAAAQRPVQTASAPPAQNIARFDGQWAAVQRCDQFENNPPYSTQLRPIQIQGGQVTIQRGQQDSAAGWYVINGTIGADGALVLTGSGVSGLKGYEGRPFNVHVRGTMTDAAYEGVGLFGRRNCSILLTRTGN